MTFVIDADNNITAYTTSSAPDGAELKLSEESFGSEKELATRLADLRRSGYSTLAPGCAT